MKIGSFCLGDIPVLAHEVLGHFDVYSVAKPENISKIEDETVRLDYEYANLNGRRGYIPAYASKRDKELNDYNLNYLIQPLEVDANIAKDIMLERLREIPKN